MEKLTPDARRLVVCRRNGCGGSAYEDDRGKPKKGKGKTPFVVLAKDVK
jgi:hypothetical protein